MRLIIPIYYSILKLGKKKEFKNLESVARDPQVSQIRQ